MLSRKPLEYALQFSTFDSLHEKYSLVLNSPLALSCRGNPQLAAHTRDKHYSFALQVVL